MGEIPTDDLENARFKAPRIGDPFRKFSGSEDESALPMEASLKKFEQLFKEAQNIAIVTDLDGTVVPYNVNPKETEIDARAKNSFTRLHNKGVTIVAMTGRSGEEGARLLGISGAVIIGTAGWEVYRVDPNDSTKGESSVHEKFHPVVGQITELLGHVREAFYQKIGRKEEGQQDLSTEVQTPAGSVVIETKARNEMFLEGLSLNFNFNRVNPEQWDDFVNSIEESFNRFVPEELRVLFQVNILKNTNGKFPACSISISPHGEEGKHKSLIELMRTDSEVNVETGERKRAQYFHDVPGGFDGVVFFGDTNQDAKALRAAHLAVVIAGRKAAGVVVARATGGGQEQALKHADVSSEGIAENSALLEHCADFAERFYRQSET